MRLCIHRGAEEIGGNCIEIESQGSSILLDLGLPLTADPDPALLPKVAGLIDGSNPQMLGVVLSHSHADHYGLTGFVHASIDIFIGAHARTVLSASQPFVGRIPLPPKLTPYRDRQPFRLGPFRITPFLVDHSAFDAYS